MNPKETRREGRIFARGKRGILWIAWHDRNGEHRMSTRSTDPVVADRMLREQLSAKDRGESYVSRSAVPTLAEMAQGIESSYVIGGKRSLRRIRQCVKHLLDFFGRDARANEIDYEAGERFVAARLADGAAPATARLELGVLRRMFALAAKRHSSGVKTVPELPSIRVDNVRKEFFTEAEIAALLTHLPPPIAALVEFASLVGWRKREMLSLQWGQVDFATGIVRLPPGTTKSRQGRTFPFREFPRVAEILEQQRRDRWRIERERGIVVTHVFNREGAPIRSIDDAWKRACARAGLPGRRLHDFRRTAVMRMERAGVSRSVAMKLIGHETESIYQRYSIAPLESLREGVRRLADFHAADSLSPLRGHSDKYSDKGDATC